jgi:hypothetical protein
MRTNQYRSDSEPLSVLYSASNTVDRTDQEPELDRTGNNRVFGGNSPSGGVAAATASRGPFPLRTLIVCFTIWLIATQAMILDQVRFETRTHLLDQSAQSLGRFHMVVPSERPPDPPTGSNVQRL